MAAKIFINYRRSDEPGFCLALYRELEPSFGQMNVFMDVEGMLKPGDNFIEVLGNKVSACDVLLVVMGPKWLTLLKQREQDSTDFVFIEINAALEQKKRIIPVLVNNAVMPQALELPESIRAIVHFHAVNLRSNSFASDCGYLVRSIKTLAVAENKSSQQQVDMSLGLGERIVSAIGHTEDPRLGASERWVLIKAGRFWRGASPDDLQAQDIEKPGGWVTLTQDYWISRWPVTVGEYRKFIEAFGYDKEEYWSTEGWSWKKDRTDRWRKFPQEASNWPVTGVSWWEAQAYCRWQSKKKVLLFAYQQKHSGKGLLEVWINILNHKEYIHGVMSGVLSWRCLRKVRSNIHSGGDVSRWSKS